MDGCKTNIISFPAGLNIDDNYTKSRHLFEHRIINDHKLLLPLAYEGRVSNKRFRIPRKTDADVHAKTRAPIQAALACAA